MLLCCFYNPTTDKERCCSYFGNVQHYHFKHHNPYICYNNINYRIRMLLLMMMWSLSSIVRCSGRVENRAIMVVFLDVSVLGLVLLAHMPISSRVAKTIGSTKIGTHIICTLKRRCAVRHGENLILLSFVATNVKYL